MPARKPPTERQRRLGVELSKTRERAGLTINQAAVMHGTDRTTVSNIESGRFGVSPDRVRVWMSNYSCRDQDYIDALAKMAKERRIGVTHWWDKYRDLLPVAALDLAELEHHSVALRSAQITHMPGLLQHEDYTRAIFDEAVPPLTSDDYVRKIEFRLQRRCVLNNPQSPACTFVLHEAALHMQFGGRQVVRSQLQHLLEQSERKNVTVRVLSFAAGGFPPAASSTLYAHGPVPRLDTVQTDSPAGSSFLHADTHLANYRAALERMTERSLDPVHSRNFIHGILKRL